MSPPPETRRDDAAEWLADPPDDFPGCTEGEWDGAGGVVGFVLGAVAILGCAVVLAFFAG